MADKKAILQSRRERDLEGLRSLVELLRSVIRHPSDYADDRGLQDALKSQGRLAKFDGSNLVPMSLNHQKTVAEEVVGSFAALNTLRREAAEALTANEKRSSDGNMRSKAGLVELVRELERENQVLREDLFLLQRAFDLRCLHARNYASTSGSAVQALCSKEQKEIDISLSLCRRTGPSNVTNIRKKKDR